MLKTAALIALLASFASTGCSVALQKKPSSGTATAANNDCTTSRTLPYVDTAGIAAGLAVAGYGLSDQEHDAGTQIMMVGSAVAFAYLVSAGTGFRWAGECRRQHEQTSPVAVR